jgi:hypothetical protein
MHDGWAHHIRTPQALARRYHLPVGGLRYWTNLYNDESTFEHCMRCEPVDESILDRYSMRAVGRWREQHLSESAGDGRDLPGVLVPVEELLLLRSSRGAEHCASSCIKFSTYPFLSLVLIVVVSQATKY